MPDIAVDKLKPGMVLKADVTHKNGRKILAKGTVLTHKHLRILKMWGIVEAKVEPFADMDVDSDDSSNIDPELYDQIEQTLTDRFRYTDLTHDITSELFEQTVHRRLRQKLEDKSGNVDDKSSQRVTSQFNGEPEANQIFHLDFDDLTNDKLKLPTLPLIFSQITEAIQNPRSSSKDIAEIVSKDTSLTARLLKLANSAFYSPRSKIDTVTQAVTMIGMNQVNSLVLGLSVVNCFKHIPSELMDMESFWKHSIACGITARILSKFSGHANGERLFLGGLLHDIGRLILCDKYPEVMRAVLQRSERSGFLLNDAENETIGIQHSAFGKILMRKWNLPESLENMVALHHNPLDCDHPVEPALINVSDIFVNALSIGSSGERYVPYLDPKVCKCIGLTVNSVGLLIKQIDRQVAESIKYFAAD